MKNFSITLLLLLTILYLNAQIYKISFIGSGLNTNVDSVYVLNLTQGTFLNMNGYDTLILGGITHTNQIDFNKNNLVIYPNPSQEGAFIEFYNNIDRQVLVEIYDLTGKPIVSYDNFFKYGLHIFNVDGFKAGFYFITLRSSDLSISSRLLVLESSNGSPLLKYINSDELNKENFFYKGSKSNIQMSYNIGERLLFKGFSGNYKRVITIIPNQDVAIDFEFVLCEDGDNYHYPVVTIGTQTWMAENLKTTKFNDGTDIPNITDNYIWGNNLITPAYGWYNNDSTYGNTYGALYNWKTVNTDILCPGGWHVPADSEWTVLSDFLLGATFAGGKLKETGNFHWNLPNTGATNETGFTILPSGYRMYDGLDYGIGNDGHWWSRYDYDSYYVWARHIGYDIANMYRSLGNKYGGFSVRCVKD